MNRHSLTRGHGATRLIVFLRMLIAILAGLLLAGGLLYLDRPALAQQSDQATTATSNNSCGLQPVAGPEITSPHSLTAITGSGSDVWAVGSTSDSTDAQTLTMHWNGSAWSRVHSPNPGVGANYLTGVTGSGNDVWAVGFQSSESGTRAVTLILHWNGSAWSQVPSPNPSTTGNILTSVTGSGSDVWAVGNYYGFGNQTLTLHWNGSSWNHVASPNPNPNEGSNRNYLYGVTGSGADVWAVGSSFNQTLMLHWNGSSWSHVASPSPGTTGNSLRDVSGSGSDVWAVGSSESQFNVQTMTLHWDGSSWSEVASPTRDTFNTELFGVTGSGSDVWAVGYYQSDSNVSQTLTLYWNGTSWSQVASPNPTYPGSHGNVLNGVTGGGSDVWAVGSYGILSLILHSGSMPFSDVQAGNPFHDYICDLYYQSIIEGYPDNTFHWEQNSTRVTLARWIVKARGWNFDLTGAPHFSDVPPSHPDYNYVETAYNKGVISGYSAADCPGGELACFQPDNSVTRGQMSKMVVNAMGWQRNTEGSPHFTDVTESNPFYWQIETIYNLGVVSGYDDHTFRWGNNLTRGQLTKVLSNALDVTPPISARSR